MSNNSTTSHYVVVHLRRFIEHYGSVEVSIILSWLHKRQEPNLINEKIFFSPSRVGILHLWTNFQSKLQVRSPNKLRLFDQEKSGPLVITYGWATYQNNGVGGWKRTSGYGLERARWLTLQ